MSWKGWSLTAFFQGTLGNKIMNAARAHYSARSLTSGGKNVLEDALSDPHFKSDANFHLPSDRYLENGNYLRLKTLTLGYTFRNLAGWAQDITIYGTANNLLTLTSYKGLDPEVNLGGLQPGLDMRETFYPHTRSYMVGVKINFGGSAEKKAEAPRTVYVTDNDEIDRLNAEVNRLRNELEAAKNVKTDNVKVIDNSRVVTFPYLVNFTIGQSDLENREKVNLETVAKMIKDTPEKKYTVYGYADKQTGTEERNAQLSQERSQNVYDILIQYGVSANQLVKAAKGGVDVMYLNDPQLSRSVIISEVK